MEVKQITARRSTAALTVWALLAAGCSGASPRPSPREARRPAARFDAATVARLCATPDSAHLAAGACELRNQAPSPALVRPLKP